MMAVDPIFEYLRMDIVPRYCHSLESSAVHTALPCFVESLHGGSSRSLPRLLLYMHAEDIIPRVSTSNFNIG